MSREAERLREIITLDSELQTTQDLDILLEKILYEARRIANADAGTIYLKKGNTLIFSYTQNETKQKDLPPGQKIIYSIFTVEINRKSISGYVAETREILNLPDVYKISKSSPYSFNKSYDKLGGYKTKLYASSIKYDGAQGERMADSVRTILPLVDQHY